MLVEVTAFMLISAYSFIILNVTLRVEMSVVPPYDEILIIFYIRYIQSPIELLA